MDTHRHRQTPVNDPVATCDDESVRSDPKRREPALARVDSLRVISLREPATEQELKPERVSVAVLFDELRLGVIGLSSGGLAGSPRNVFRHGASQDHRATVIGGDQVRTRA